MGRWRCLRFLSLSVMTWVKMKRMCTEITALFLRFYEDTCEENTGFKTSLIQKAAQAL